MTGWKVLANDQVHEKDRIEGAIKLVDNAEGVIKYDRSRIGIAIFGLGRIGTVWIDRVLRNPRLRLVACVESCQERCHYIEYAFNLDNVRMISPDNADEVFNDPQVEAVIIATPTASHQELVLRSLSSGKAVLCEKPLADSLEAVENCIKLAGQMKRPLVTALNRRFDPTFRIVRNRVKKGEIGKVRIIKALLRESPPAPISYLKGSSGIFLDAGIHCIDLICWIVEEYPIKVQATGSAFIKDIREMGDFDTVAVLLTFPSGAIGMIDLSRTSAYGFDEKLEVFGPLGMLTGSNTRPTGVVLDSGLGTTQVPHHYSFISRFSESYTNELEHFVDCVKGK